MGLRKKEMQITTIRFDSINEDAQNKKYPIRRATSTLNRQNPKLEVNFSLEQSFPVVIFDKICFSVDRSQQQANFLNESIHRLKDCIRTKEDPNASSRIDILKSINLNVPTGSIFGLLGPSSCGKTTLLRCLVGLLKPTSGCIRLFGHSAEDDNTDDFISNGCTFSRKVSSRSYRQSKCKVPGSNVGYMPQDLGLYEDFTIRQLLAMFGRYMKMESELIESRINFMTSFLDLPDTNRPIFTLSGGQKRRVSFAIACLHMPPLIILDEPTVGVDPLLRRSIWKYLRHLADKENKTIIITTHYIEEAAQADQVALMRAGEILIQDSPKKIIKSNDCKTLEEAFLKICNNVKQNKSGTNKHQRLKLYPQPRFNWDITCDDFKSKNEKLDEDEVVRELRHKAQEKLAIYDELQKAKSTQVCSQHNLKLVNNTNKLSMEPNISLSKVRQTDKGRQRVINQEYEAEWLSLTSSNERKKRLLRGSKFVVNNSVALDRDSLDVAANDIRSDLNRKVRGNLTLLWALLYKNYQRNVNSLPLLAFQFMLPIIQMISFSLCVGGRPTDIGLGLVNLDHLPTNLIKLPDQPILNSTVLVNSEDYTYPIEEELLSLKYLSFIDHSMIKVKEYDSLKDALNDVRDAKLWAALEIGENFTSTITKRFDLDNFYHLDANIIQQSVMKLYPDRSNKVLDMICHRSLINSYRKFLLDQFEHFRRLPIEVKEPIFDIKPNLISNSIDGYTESIAAGLLASLTYIMAAGLTTFIMVVERSAGILERTYTSGVNPIAYLMAHALFRSLVMMVQIAVVMFLTFYLLQQPLVGSIWLAYFILMTLNLTGISYGLLISSIVSDQNAAALTIVSSLVVKITLSGILWPFEAIPRWLRVICYAQPLTMPVQALKSITLKGGSLDDRTVQIGFAVAITWLALFLTIAAKRFKFYQH